MGRKVHKSKGWHKGLTAAAILASEQEKEKKKKARKRLMERWGMSNE